VAPLAFMRGRTFSDCFILLDEAQNTNPAQMKMFLTRLGFGSKMIVTGDVTQLDLGNKISGLVQVREILEGMEDIAFCDFSGTDVVRHSLVAEIVSAYSQYEDKMGRSRASAMAKAHAATEADAQQSTEVPNDEGKTEGED